MDIKINFIAALLVAYIAMAKCAIKCYVCQRSMKSGYTSPFKQPGCSLEEIRKYPKHYVEQCKDDVGCKLIQWFEGGTLISEKRTCGSANSGSTNSITKQLYCRTADDCSNPAASGSSVSTPLKCKSVSSQYQTAITADALSGCSDSAAGKTKGFCTRTTTLVDYLAEGGYRNRYPGPSYSLSCSSLDQDMFTGKQYTLVTKLCANSLCNADPAATASALKMTVTTLLGAALLVLVINN